MKLPIWRHVRQRLSTQVVLLMVAILVLTMAGGFFVLQRNLREQLNDQFEHRALSIAQTLAGEQSVAEQAAAGRPGGQLQVLATQVQQQTGALFVVITNAQGIRLTHPNPALIGTPITYHDPEPDTTEPFRTGRPWVGMQHGTLGLVAAGKVPLWLNGRLVGQVSVGYPVQNVNSALAGALLSFIAYLLGVLAVGVLAALALARRLKRQTFGLELSEIAALLQEREAMLHGIREAVLGYDTGGRILLANDAARDLLGLPAEFAGRKLRYLLPPGRLADVATGVVTGATCSCCTRTGCSSPTGCRSPATTSSSAGWSPSRTAPSPRRSSGRWTRRPAWPTRCAPSRMSSRTGCTPWWAWSSSATTPRRSSS